MSSALGMGEGGGAISSFELCPSGTPLSSQTQPWGRGKGGGGDLSYLGGLCAQGALSDGSDRLVNTADITLAGQPSPLQNKPCMCMPCAADHPLVVGLHALASLWQSAQV
jgi:hypothetical protein